MTEPTARPSRLAYAQARVPRLLLLAAFIASVAAGLALARASWEAVLVVMALAWLIASGIEWLAWVEERRGGGPPPAEPAAGVPADEVPAAAASVTHATADEATDASTGKRAAGTTRRPSKAGGGGKRPRAKTQEKPTSERAAKSESRGEGGATEEAKPAAKPRKGSGRAGTGGAKGAARRRPQA